MVEHAVSSTAQVARKIPRINAWAVTGTPVGKNGLDDLYGLILFLDIEPIASIRQIWTRLTDPMNRGDLLRFLTHFMHRNLKKAVDDELKLPVQHEHVYTLDFSPIERHYYDMQVATAKASIKNLEDAERRKSIASWLLQLRQTCCHIQVSTKNRDLLGEELKTMEEVLLHMVRFIRTSFVSDSFLAGAIIDQSLEFARNNGPMSDQKVSNTRVHTFTHKCN